MAHKTLLGGTSYDISGGKTLVNGTAYSIAGGKTLVSGTAYNISFGVDLAALFSGMTVLNVVGRNSSTRNTVQMYVTDYLQSGETAYVLSFGSGNVSITKIKRGTDRGTILYQSSSTSGNIYFDAYDQLAYSDDGWTSITKKYGATLALVQFDQPETKVDAALSALQYVTSTGRNTSSIAATDVTSQANSCSIGDIAFVAVEKLFAVNIRTSSNTFDNLAGNASSIPTLLFTENGNLYIGAYGSLSYDKYYGTTFHVVRGG